MMHESVLLLEKTQEVKFIGYGNSKNIQIEKPLSEVELLSQHDFNYTRNSMSIEIDDVYNTNLSLGNASSSHGKENWIPQRIH